MSIETPNVTDVPYNPFVQAGIACLVMREAGIDYDSTYINRDTNSTTDPVSAVVTFAKNGVIGELGLRKLKSVGIDVPLQ